MGVLENFLKKIKRGGTLIRDPRLYAKLKIGLVLLAHRNQVIYIFFIHNSIFKQNKKNPEKERQKNFQRSGDAVFSIGCTQV